MKNPDHFHMAKELNVLFDTDRPAALSKAIDYINARDFDHMRLERRSSILPTRLDLLLKRQRHFDEDEGKRFLLAVIELLAEFGTPIEPEF